MSNAILMEQVRSEMIQAYEKGKPLTDKHVLTISQKLDEILNTYYKDKYCKN